MSMHRIHASRPVAHRADVRDIGVLGHAAAAREIPVLGAASMLLAAFELVSEGFDALNTALGRVIARRRVLAELSALDDRMLKDIGLERGNLDAVFGAHRPSAVDGLARANDNLAGPANDRGPRAAA
jgi:uncharacterized protein YjiS (DUF1127 family)